MLKKAELEFCKLYPETGFDSLLSYKISHANDIYQRSQDKPPYIQSYWDLMNKITNSGTPQSLFGDLYKPVENLSPEIQVYDQELRKESEASPRQRIIDAYFIAFKEIEKVRASNLLIRTDIWKEILSNLTDSQHHKTIRKYYDNAIKVGKECPLEVFDELVMKDSGMNKMIQLKRLCSAYYFFSFLDRDYFKFNTKRKIIELYELIQMVIRTEKFGETARQLRVIKKDLMPFIYLKQCLVEEKDYRIWNKKTQKPVKKLVKRVLR